MKKINTLFLLLFVVTLAKAQDYTAIPDPNFELELINDGVDSEGFLDGRILTSDAATTQVLILTGSFKPDADKITDLTGIEAFVNLRILRCAGNRLTELDVSNNFRLEELQCQSNNLSTLDLSANPDLNQLFCNNNNLTRLDVSENENLIRLRCQTNQITTLDVTALIGLIELRCQSNNLQLNLNVSQNTSLVTFSATSNPDLLCIQVADAAGANAGIGIYTSWTKQNTTLYSENCNSIFPTTRVPDDNFEQALIDLGYDEALDDRVLTNNISDLTDLDVSGRNISNMEGIEDFEALQNLNVGDNEINILDVSANTNLEVLDCRNNSIHTLTITGLEDLIELNCSNNIGITSLNLADASNLEVLICSNLLSLGNLDVSQNGDLRSLNCTNSSLENLDLSLNFNLFELRAGFNQLRELDVSNNSGLQVVNVTDNLITNLDFSNNALLTELVFANNRIQGRIDLAQNPLLAAIISTGNSSLYCIQVADAAAADAGIGIYSGWNKSDYTEYSEDCSQVVTYVPDDAFESYLMDQGLDGAMDNYVRTVNILEVDDVNVSNRGVVDMTGIEDFEGLVFLNCRNNLITRLDVSQNSLLEAVDCSVNQIAELILNTTSLRNLECNNNQLTSLNLSQNPNLNILRCEENQIGILNLSTNLELISVNCSSNQITNMALGANTNIRTLNASNNLLGGLNVTQNTALETLLMNNNNLQERFDVAPLASLTTFNVTENDELYCINVSDPEDATNRLGIYVNWEKDDQAIYNDNCIILSSEEFENLEKAIRVHPNPARDNVFVTVPNDIDVEEVTLYNLQGRVVLQSKTYAQGIDVNRLQEGVYFLAIKTGEYTITKKVIVSRR